MIPFNRVHQRRSRRQEDGVAADTGGRRVAGSGSLPSLKGDVRCPDLLIECKTTSASSYSLTLKVLRKIEKEAEHANKEPILQVDIQGRRYVVLRYEDWLRRNNRD